MPRLRIALAQVDLTVGDLTGNASAIRDWTALAAEADLVLFPEMAVTGYPPEDLVLRSSFVEASHAALEGLAQDLDGSPAVVVGYLGRDADGEPQNRAALLHGGRVVTSYAKHHLPNYGVFDERRYFTPGDELAVVRLHGVDVALTICEDLWQDGGPLAVCAAAGVGLVVCINGSPYERNKDDVRLELAARRAREAGAALAYVNTVGGQDELVFDGDSLVVDATGALVARAPQFEEHLLTVDVDVPVATHDDCPVAAGMRVTRTTLSTTPPPTRPTQVHPVATRLGDEAEVWAAVVTGTRDYVRKNGFSSVCLGLSGGIDSAVVATIAIDALGADAVHTVAMPSKHSSQHSLDDAADLARRQGIHHQVIPIAPMVDAYLEATPLHGLADENLQARVRGTLLMALSNEHGHLVLTTGNKSELATGFSTLYGDSAGGFAPIKDVPKTWVWRLARWRNSVAVGEPPIPESSITKPPSAELAPGQLDADRLPDYELLDAVLDDYVEGDVGRAGLLAAGHDPAIVERVIRLVDLAEYKRRQYPPGPKLTPKAFGRDRRLPITNRWREPLQ